MWLKSELLCLSLLVTCVRITLHVCSRDMSDMSEYLCVSLLLACVRITEHQIISDIIMSELLCISLLVTIETL